MPSDLWSNKTGLNLIIVQESPKYFNNVLICSLNNFGDIYWILIDWLINFNECPNVSITNCNKLRGNFVYHWGCISIYRPLCYPFRSSSGRMSFPNSQSIDRFSPNLCCIGRVLWLDHIFSKQQSNCHMLYHHRVLVLVFSTFYSLEYEWIFMELLFPR